MKVGSIVVLLSLFLGILIGCDDDDASTEEQESDTLEEMLFEIIKIAESVDCVTPDDWTFTPIGSKACGGPTGFLAYSVTIDTNDFLEKVEAYKEAMNAFNIKWGVISDCALPATPVGVTCVDGKAELVY